MASFFITSAVAQGMLNGTGLNSALGASPLIKIYAGSFSPASQDADSTITSPTLLATLTCAASPLSGGFSSVGTTPTAKARATFGTIASASAVATGTAAYFDITTSAGTVIARGDVSTVAAATGSLQLNTTAVTTGSTVAITAATIDLPRGA